MNYWYDHVDHDLTAEDYELLCEVFGSLVIDEAIEEKNNGEQKRQLDKRRGA